jgi:hypothetical protein
MDTGVCSVVAKSHKRKACAGATKKSQKRTQVLPARQQADGRQKGQNNVTAATKEDNHLTSDDIKLGIEAWELFNGLNAGSQVQQQPTVSHHNQTPAEARQLLSTIKKKPLSASSPPHQPTGDQKMPTNPMLDVRAPEFLDILRTDYEMAFNSEEEGALIRRQLLLGHEDMQCKMPTNLMLDVRAPEFLDILRTDYEMVFNSEEEGALIRRQLLLGHEDMQCRHHV